MDCKGPSDHGIVTNLQEGKLAYMCPKCQILFQLVSNALFFLTWTTISWLKIILEKTEAPRGKQLTDCPTDLAVKHPNLTSLPCTCGQALAGEEWNGLN